MLSGEFTRSDSLSRVSLEAITTFTCLVSMADDFGRFDARPRYLLSALFPLRDDVTLEALVKWLAELEAEGVVRFYEVEGRPYLEIPSWSKYQRLRAAQSKFPAPSAPAIEESEPCVYFVRLGEGGPVKIGFTLILKQRLSQLQTSAAEPLQVLGTIPGATRALEKRLHRQFSHLRTSGEWFAAEEELLDWIREHTQAGPGDGGQRTGLPVLPVPQAGHGGPHGPVERRETRDESRETGRGGSRRPPRRAAPPPGSEWIEEASYLALRIQARHPTTKPPPKDLTSWARDLERLGRPAAEVRETVDWVLSEAGVEAGFVVLSASSLARDRHGDGRKYDRIRAVMERTPRQRHARSEAERRERIDRSRDDEEAHRDEITRGWVEEGRLDEAPLVIRRRAQQLGLVPGTGEAA